MERRIYQVDAFSTQLTPYWSKRLDKLGLHARQVSERGGDVGSVLHGDRVRLSGHAAFFLEGTLTI